MKKSDVHDVIHTYIEMHKKRTVCMQQRFKVACFRCGRYQKCNIMPLYVKSWCKLQKTQRELKSELVKETKKSKEEKAKDRQRSPS